MKSGLFKTFVDKEAEVPQEWPHLNLMYVRHGIGFFDLNMELFLCGELLIINNCSVSTEKAGRIELLRALMYDASVLDINYVLTVYATWVRSIECGEEDWGNDFTTLRSQVMNRYI